MRSYSTGGWSVSTIYVLDDSIYSLPCFFRSPRATLFVSILLHVDDIYNCVAYGSRLMLVRLPSLSTSKTSFNCPCSVEIQLLESIGENHMDAMADIFSHWAGVQVT